MQVAFQTVSWGPRVERWADVFKTLHALGYDGVEIAQPPDLLPSPGELRGVLEELGLAFVGFAGGTLSRRIEYCRTYDEEFRPRYLDVDGWEERPCRRALDAGFRLGLHPHLYRRVHGMETAARLLEEHGELDLLPDTAHLHLARDDAAGVIRRYANRLAGVHFKDWTPVFGRSLHRYARGVVELGEGIVDLGAVLAALREIAFDGWLVVEQDWTPRDPRFSAEASRGWLERHGIPLRPRTPRDDLGASESVQPKPTCPSPERVLEFTDSLVRARHRDVASFCEKAAEAVGRLASSKAVSIWEHSPRAGSLELLAMWPGDWAEPPVILDCAGALSGLTVDRQAISRFDVRRAHDGHAFARPGLAKHFGITTMISIPVLNTYSSTHVQLVINVFTTEEAAEMVGDDDLARCADDIARMYERVLEAACQSAASMVNQAAESRRRVSEFLDEVIRTIRRTVHGEGVTFFLPDAVGQTLQEQTTTGIAWRADVPPTQHDYAEGEGLVGKVWQHREPRLTADAPREPGYVGKSFERVKGTQEVLLIAPIPNTQGEALAVVRCRNKWAEHAPSGVNVFTESDVSIIDAIGQAMAPHLAVLQAHERRTRTLSRLTHELKVPLHVVIGAAEFIERESQLKGYRFTHPCVEDVRSWCDLARRLLEKVDFFRYGREGLELMPRHSFLLEDVLGPVCHQIDPLLRERGFSRHSIRHDGFVSIPRLWVDRNQLQQVFFNLISNAVKYAYWDAGAFPVEVTSRTAPDGYEILFRDWGPGIPEAWAERVFEEGVRGPDAVQDNVGGDGLGLWIVREIIRQHGGRIHVSRTGQPTEFTIWLPRTLAAPWTAMPGG